MINITTKEKLDREVKKLSGLYISSFGQRDNIIDVSLNGKIKLYKISPHLVNCFYDKIYLLFEN